MDTNDDIDRETVEAVLANPPFLSIPGIVNIRDIGASAPPYIRKGLIYRSGAINNAPSSSLALLKDELGIKCILDLRSNGEITRLPNPPIEGVTNLHFDSLKVPSPIDLNDFVDEGGKKGYVKMYSEVLDIYKPSVTKILEHIRDDKGPILFHCTAGKDRTGVLAALLLSLSGAPRETIAFDYSLTRIGIEPSRELLLQMLKMWNKAWTAQTPGMKEFVQMKEEFMLGTLEMVEERYGGVEGYVRGLGFGDEELERIREVLRGV